MPSSLTTCLFLCINATYAISQARAQDIFLQPQLSSQLDWNALNASTSGRLFAGIPYSKPCFVQSFNSTSCVAARSNYLDEGESCSTHFLQDQSPATTLAVTRSNTPGAYIQTQWETCQAINDQCLLDYLNLGNVSPTLPPLRCEAGSVPSYFVCILVFITYVMLLMRYIELKIDVQSPGDVSAAFAFATKTNVTLTIKNTGVRLSCVILEQYLFLIPTA